MKRIHIETKLHESRLWLLTTYGALNEEQLRRPVTASEHDEHNMWSPLDHFSHLALIERNFNSIIRRHIDGHDDAVGLTVGPSGERRTREQIMATVHAMTDKFQSQHRDDTLGEVVALTAAARAETLALLAELSDEQIDQVVPGAPWADGTVGGILGVNADHATMHWRWVTDAGFDPSI